MTAMPPRDVDGRTLTPAPMPPELAATVDPAKNTPGPVDTPPELARRVRLLADIRRDRPPLNPPPAEEEL